MTPREVRELTVDEFEAFTRHMKAEAREMERSRSRGRKR